MFELPKILIIQAPAKINLHLAVGGRRPDGFHDIESVFLAVDFADTLHFEVSDTVSDTLEILNFDLPMGKNIIFRALSLFREKTGLPAHGLHINVEKRIPAGGGLGGGSSDAAATLKALNKLCGSPLSRDQLMELGTQLGSDVSFFLGDSGAAIVSGRGEIITPFEWPPCFVVLVNPGFPSDTSEAYRLLDEYRRGRREFYHEPHEPTRTEEESGRTVCRSFFNDFLQVFKEPEKSIYQGIISQLNELRAEFSGLSGSGSTCFGLFKEGVQAEKAAASLRDSWKFVESCSSIEKLT